MKNLIILIISLFLLTPVSFAAERDYTGPDSIDNLWSAAKRYGVSEDGDLEHGLQNLTEQIINTNSILFSESARVGIQLLSAALLCGLAEGFCTYGGRLNPVRLAGALAVTTISVNDINAMVGLGRQTIHATAEFSKILLPVMASLTAAAGKISAAAVRQGTTVLFTQLLLDLIDQLLIPMVYTYIAICCAHAAVGNTGLKKLGNVIKGTIQITITVILISFVGYMTMTGAVAGSADAAAVKAAKMAMTRIIPVVGGILSDTAESVLVGAGILKGTVGVVGLLVVLSICAVPFFRLGFQYLTYKLAAAITSTVADSQLSGLLDSIGSAFGLVLGMAGASALMLLFSIVSSVTAVSL